MQNNIWKGHNDSLIYMIDVDKNDKNVKNEKKIEKIVNSFRMGGISHLAVHSIEQTVQH